MRPWVLGFWCALVLHCSVQGFAQQAVPRTLEALAQTVEAENAPAAPEAEPRDTGPKRPAGTLVRPKDGVQHPDLDKAWADYDTAGTKAAEGIRAAINKQFDAAAAKGDLDAAEKWQAALEKFEKAGEVPAESETKAAVSSAASEYKKAREELSKVYETVMKNLTMEKKIADAKAVRGEWLAMSEDKKEEATTSTASSIAEKATGELQKVVFLSDLEEQMVSVTAGWGWSFGKNGDIGNGRKEQILVRGLASKKGLSMHPAAKGVSSVTYNVPDGCFRFEAKAAIDDSSRGQRSPVVFEVVSGEKVLWKSRPLQGAGVSDVCAITIKDSKTIVLRATCVGDNFGAHAVWVDPRFLRK